MNRRQLMAAVVALPASAGVKEPNVNTMSVEELIAYLNKRISETVQEALAGAHAWEMDLNSPIYGVLEEVKKKRKARS